MNNLTADVVVDPVHQLALHGHPVVQVHEHIVDLNDGLFQLENLGVSVLDPLEVFFGVLVSLEIVYYMYWGW